MPAHMAHRHPHAVRAPLTKSPQVHPPISGKRLFDPPV
ncbi:hypothetical protein CDS [Bradyrhizobium sp.]|nr:hypothetical protein CDS [Bradyrhizobium sp.]